MHHAPRIVDTTTNDARQAGYLPALAATDHATEAA